METQRPKQKLKEWHKSREDVQEASEDSKTTKRTCRSDLGQ